MFGSRLLVGVLCIVCGNALRVNDDGIPAIWSTLLTTPAVVKAASTAVYDIKVNTQPKNDIKVNTQPKNAVIDTRPEMLKLLRDMKLISPESLSQVENLELLKSKMNVTDDNIVGSVQTITESADFEHLVLETLPKLTREVAGNPPLVGLIDNLVAHIGSQSPAPGMVSTVMPHVANIANELKHTILRVAPARELMFLQVAPANTVERGEGETSNGESDEFGNNELDISSASSTTTTLTEVVHRGADGKQYTPGEEPRTDGLNTREEFGFNIRLSLPAMCKHARDNQTDYCMCMDIGPWGMREMTHERGRERHNDVYWVLPIGVTVKLATVSITLTLVFDIFHGRPTRLVNIPGFEMTFGSGANNLERTSTRAISMSLYMYTSRPGFSIPFLPPVDIRNPSSATKYSHYPGSSYEHYAEETTKQHHNRIAHTPRDTKVGYHPHDLAKLVKWKLGFVPAGVSFNFGSPTGNYVFQGDYQVSVSFASKVSVTYYTDKYFDVNRLMLSAYLTKPWGGLNVTSGNFTSALKDWGSFSIGAFEC